MNPTEAAQTSSAATTNPFGIVNVPRSTKAAPMRMVASAMYAKTGMPKPCTTASATNTIAITSSTSA